MFKPPKATPQCLSRWQISQLALMEPHALPSAPAEHVKGCSSCAGLLREERELVVSQQQATLPVFLQQRLQDRVQPTSAAAARSPIGRVRSWWQWRPVWGLGGLGVLASGAVAAVLLLPSLDPRSTERSKGATELRLSVMRADQIIADDVRISEAPALQAGDRLRLRVLSPQRWGALWAQADASWNELFVGNFPLDGWLPVGFRYDDAARTHLRLILCPKAPEPKQVASADSKPKRCERVDFDL